MVKENKKKNEIEKSFNDVEIDDDYSIYFNFKTNDVKKVNAYILKETGIPFEFKYSKEIFSFFLNYKDIEGNFTIYGDIEDDTDLSKFDLSHNDISDLSEKSVNFMVLRNLGRNVHICKGSGDSSFPQFCKVIKKLCFEKVEK